MSEVTDAEWIAELEELNAGKLHQILELQKERDEARINAIRECANVAQALSDKWHAEYKRGSHCGDTHHEGMSDGASEVADAIRLIETSPSPNTLK